MLKVSMLQLYKQDLLSCSLYSPQLSFLLQEVQAVNMSSIPTPYVMGAVSTLRRLRDDLLNAQGTSIAPPIDDSIIPGAYAEVLGLQSQHKRHARGPPQAKSKRVLRAVTKRERTALPAYKQIYSLFLPWSNPSSVQLMTT